MFRFILSSNDPDGIESIREEVQKAVGTVSQVLISPMVHQEFGSSDFSLSIGERNDDDMVMVADIDCDVFIEYGIEEKTND